jgi:hypothetical protein
MRTLRLLVAAILGLGVGFVVGAQRRAEGLPDAAKQWVTVGENAAIAVTAFTSRGNRPSIQGKLMIRIGEAWHEVQFDPPQAGVYPAK